DRFVRALRTETGAPAIPAHPDTLEDLIERHRAGGLDVAAAVQGERTGVPRSVAWAAHRIVQEALTNAARHGTGPATLAVDLGPDGAAITVVNPAACKRHGRAGHGIVGMRERAALLGGRLDVAEHDGRFRLHA